MGVGGGIGRRIWVGRGSQDSSVGDGDQRGNGDQLIVRRTDSRVNSLTDFLLILYFLRVNHKHRINCNPLEAGTDLNPLQEGPLTNLNILIWVWVLTSFYCRA